MKSILIIALALSALILLAESSPLKVRQDESSESSEERTAMIAKRQEDSSEGKFLASNISNNHYN